MFKLVYTNNYKKEISKIDTTNIPVPSRRSTINTKTNVTAAIARIEPKNTTLYDSNDTIFNKGMLHKVSNYSFCASCGNINNP
jgi:hypothetical protein